MTFPLFPVPAAHPAEAKAVSQTQDEPGKQPGAGVKAEDFPLFILLNNSLRASSPPPQRAQEKDASQLEKAIQDAWLRIALPWI